MPAIQSQQPWLRLALPPDRRGRAGDRFEETVCRSNRAGRPLSVSRKERTLKVGLTIWVVAAGLVVGACGGDDTDSGGKSDRKSVKKAAAPAAKGRSMADVGTCFEGIPLNTFINAHVGPTITESQSGSGPSGGDEKRPFAVAAIAKTEADAKAFEATIGGLAKESYVPSPVQESGTVGTYVWGVAGGDTSFGDYTKALECVKP